MAERAGGRDGWRDRGKRRNREREERNPPPYALTPSKGTTTHALLQARIHTPCLPSRALASRQIVLRRYTRTKERVDDRFSDRDSLDREDGKGFLLANEKKLENGNEKEKNEIGE